jgi:hypothetical protein
MRSTAAPLSRRRGDEPRAQRMPGELRRIESRKLGIVFDDLGDRAIGQRRRLQPAALEHRPKHRTICTIR